MKVFLGGGRSPVKLPYQIIIPQVKKNASAGIKKTRREVLVLNDCKRSYNNPVPLLTSVFYLLTSFSLSGHSKWATIKRKKDVTDSKRGKIFTQHAKMVALAAQQGGGDPSMNPSLRAAIDRAKLDNVPNANIERAIKKGTGELKEGEAISELAYEGYGPGGVAFYVEVVTDNKNRAVSNVRSLFTKHGGNLGGAGSVAWMFEKKGVLEVEAVGTEGTAMAGKSRDDVELALIESGAEDLEFGEDDGAGGAGVTAVVYTKFGDLMTVKKALETAGFKVVRAEGEFIPKNTVAITDPEMAGKVMRLADALEEDEDVTSVSINADLGS